MLPRFRFIGAPAGRLARPFPLGRGPDRGPDACV